jgi:hypothetical protein
MGHWRIRKRLCSVWGARRPVFDVVEDGAAGVVSGWPGATVDESGFQRGHEALGLGVVVGVAAAAHALEDAGVAQRATDRPARAVTAAVGVVDEVSGGLAAPEAISTASTTSAAWRSSRIDQPTIPREQASTTTATYSQPCQVRT